MEYRRQAYLLALQLTAEREAALDVAQEAMVRLYATLGRVDPSRGVRPWLFTIVRNLARDLRRRQRVRRTDALDAGDLSETLVEGSPNPEQALECTRVQRRLWRAISGLPAEKREILVLRDFHDLTYAEIAHVLRVPIGTVMSRLHAARATLRARFAREADRA